METQVLSRHEIVIDREDDVVLVRRKVRALAQARGFDAFAIAAVTTAASEIARNVWIHAKGGAATVEELSDGGRFALRLCFVDRGPGIADLERALAGGNSTIRSLGLGLSGSQRLVDEFSIESSPSGTKVVLLKWTRF